MEILDKLITESEQVKVKCYKTGKYQPDYISGEEYSEWINKCHLVLNNYCKDKSILNEFNKVSKENCYESEFNSIVGLLKAVNKSYDLLENNEKTNKNKKIFVSHCSKDRHITDGFVDLLKIIGVKDNEIYYSSYEETGADYLEDCLDRIKKEFEENELMILFMISRDFYKSKVCLAEMGATWVTSFERYIPIILPPLEYNDIQGVIKGTQNGILLTSNEVKTKLGQLKGKIEEYLDIKDRVSSTEWDRARDKFIKIIKDVQQNSTVLHYNIEDITIYNNRLIAKIYVQNNTKSRIELEEVKINLKVRDTEDIEFAIDDWSVRSVVVQPLESVTFFISFELKDKVRRSDISGKNSKINVLYYEKN